MKEQQQLSGSHNAHSRLAPSASSRWTTCTASPAFIASLKQGGRLPKEVESPHATLGTLAHDHATAILTNDDKMLEGLDPLPSDSAEAVGAYVNYCDSITPPGNTPFVESIVPLFYSDDPSDVGTSDFAVITDDWIEISDYKNGAGIRVDAFENTQLAIYAMSFLKELSEDGLIDLTPTTEIRLTIVQPRHHERNGPDTWSLTYEDFSSFCDGIQDKAMEARSEDTVFAPSESACRWCDAKALCKARLDAMAPPELETVDLLTSFDDLTKEQVKGKSPVERMTMRENGEQLSDDQVVALFANTKAIISYLADVQEYLQTNADQGTPLVGTKLVAGRMGNTKWKDDEDADNTIKRKLSADQRYKKTLISPTQARKLMQPLSDTMERRFRELTERAPAKNVVTASDDPREEVKPASADFEHLEE